MALEGYYRSYAVVVLVSSLILTFFGAVDIFEAANHASKCTYMAGIIPMQMCQYGVLSLVSGLLLCYIIGREIPLKAAVFYSNVYWTSFRGITWIIVILIYISALGTGFGVRDSLVGAKQSASYNATDCLSLALDTYIGFRLFLSCAVPFSPILLVAAILGFCIFLYILYCCLTMFSGADHDN